MLRREVICAFYNQKVNDHKEYQNFMNTIVENKDKLKPLYYEDDDGKILIVFYKKRLKTVTNSFSGENADFLNGVINGNHGHCSKCGCGYLRYFRYTYRDNCGCLGKSYECEVCQGYSDKAVRKIRDYARKRGTKKALLKVLNGKFFKEEDFQNNEENYYDDLPFGMEERL